MASTSKRPVFRCEVCDVAMTCAKSLQAHLQGRKHLERMFKRKRMKICMDDGAALKKTLRILLQVNGSSRPSPVSQKASNGATHKGERTEGNILEKSCGTCEM
eukprot:jgi/Bigna1/81795/fgenesh1_pg.84_\